MPREAALATVMTLVRAGQDVSFQLVGTGPDDPYLEQITAAIRRTFDDTVPALVAPLSTLGRAGEWRKGNQGHRDQQPIAMPCVFAAWPVVTFDGRVVGCCQQHVVDGPAPSHLRLGRAPGVGWPAVARAVRERAALRALRTFGPEVLARQARAELSEHGYCGTCAALDELTRRPSFPVLEDEIQRHYRQGSPDGFARRFGIAKYAHMLTLGLSRDCAGDGQVAIQEGMADATSAR